MSRLDVGLSSCRSLASGILLRHVLLLNYFVILRRRSNSPREFCISALSSGWLLIRKSWYPFWLSASARTVTDWVQPFSGTIRWSSRRLISRKLLRFASFVRPGRAAASFYGLKFVHVIAIKSLYRLMSVSLPGTVYCGFYGRLKIWVVEKVPISLSN